MRKSKSKPKNMRDHANQLADRLAPHVESARGKAAPVIADAKVKAAPLVAEAREKTAPALNEARDRFTHEVLPVLTAAVAAANEATEDVREEARKRGLATAAALKGELDAPPEKKHRLRKLLMVLGLGGIVALVMKKLSDRQATSAWQSSYQPKPPTSSTSTSTGPSAVDETPIATAAAGTAAGTADDEAASSPDEAVADAAESPHVPSTPDNPATEVDVDKRV